MKIRLSERGQALAEYMPLIPPILLLSVLILVPLSDSAGDIFCQMVNSMEPEKCQVAAVEDGEAMRSEPRCGCLGQDALSRNFGC